MASRHKRRDIRKQRADGGKIIPRRGALKPRASLWARLFAPVDILPLVYLRIVFGAIMVFEVWKFYDMGWITRNWVRPQFHFTYYGFGWVHPWPGDGMYVHFLVVGALAAFILIGFWYRVSAALFVVGFGYIFLIDETEYLNHFYMLLLVSFLLIFVPANRAFSVDARLRPETRSETAPAWALWLLRAQIGIVYFYGGLAKLGADWLDGEPMRTWLAVRTDFPLAGPLFTEEWVVLLFSYGGLLFDLLVVPMLFWGPTRLGAIAFCTLFHLTNAQLFNIGIFPWFMIAAIVIFLPPHWLRLGLRRLSPRHGEQPAHLTPAESRGLAAVSWAALQRRQRRILMFVGAYLLLQALVPFRHLLYPGDPNWTEEGHRFSWHMMLRTKSAAIRFVASDPVSKKAWEVEARDYLTIRQYRKMSRNPDLILQFSHFLADQLRKDGYDRIQIRVDTKVSLNQRMPQALVDPKLNLAAQPRTLGPAPWIIPLRPR